jgi:hypothetical protein
VQASDKNEETIQLIISFNKQGETVAVIWFSGRSTVLPIDAG